MSVTGRDTISLYGRLASLLGAKVSRPDARNAGIALSHDIVAFAHADHEAVLRQLRTSPDGLDIGEAEARLQTIGSNVIGQEARPSIARELAGRAMNP